MSGTKGLSEQPVPKKVNSENSLGLSWWMASMHFLTT